MHHPARILVVDDMPQNVDIVRKRLEMNGYEVVTAQDGEQALVRVSEESPDLILLDIMMPKIDGIEVLRRLKADAALPFTPVVLLTAKSDSRDIVEGLEAGADEYLSKPFDPTTLVARVRAMLRIKALHDQVKQQTEALDHWAATLQQQVTSQIAEIDRIGRLKRFLAPQIAELIMSSGSDEVLQTHRRNVVVLFCDMRGFTSFAEISEPEDVMRVLNEYHSALGPLIHGREGTLERFTGDGLMVFFNDPLPCSDPSRRAVLLAIEMRQAVTELSARWAELGHRIGFGVGIAEGYATLGRIGFEGRFDYAAIGTVTNLAARLCGEAKDGQILVTERVASELAGLADVEPIGDMSLKGLSRPIPVRNVVRLRS